MKADGIQTSIHYPPVHRFSYYRRRYADSPNLRLPVTEDVAEREVTLPLFPSMTDEAIQAVISSVGTAMEKLVQNQGT
jgi:dTDP-4-amino-4,6-dideoxygalactose transaminase